MKQSEKYVGRTVRLKAELFGKLAERRTRNKEGIENLFLVAAISQKMKKLICYGADLRIMVCASDVILV